ncbi:MAG: DUF1294 domain-containing protein [Christensenellales bacterium]|jgi:uncharacterized membrane protein YsdA (DUF1294 family)
MSELFVWYVLGINALNFLLFGLDKLFAVKRMFRIPENVLIGISVAGGALGGLFAMSLFRHKTKHKAFIISVLSALLCQLLIFGIYILRYNNIL